MRNNLFSAFYYLLSVSISSKTHYQVKVFFVYKYEVIILLVPIKKVSSHQDEAYYISEAKKVIKGMIKEGSLKKYAEKYIEKKKKRKKILIFIIIIFSIVALAGIGYGAYRLIPDSPPPPPPPPPTPTYEVTLINNDRGALSLSKNTVIEGESFEADITLNRTIFLDKIMPEELGESDVKCLEEPITYTYSVDESRYSAHINIPKENIKGKITINVPLITPEMFQIVLDANAGQFEHGFSTITLNALAGVPLKELNGYQKPTDFREGYHFTHWELLPNRNEEDDLYEEDPVPYTASGAYVANCERNEIAVTINPDGGTFPGKAQGETLHLSTLYDTVINQISGYTGEPIKAGYKFLYYAVDGATDSKQYLPTDTVTIPGFTLNLRAVYSNSLKITLEANGGTFPEGAVTYFDTSSGISLSELTGYMEPTLTGQVFTHWTINETDTYYQDTKLNMTGEFTLVAQYEVCTAHNFTSYTIINNKLYGICSICGARVLISDEALADYSNQFLLYKDGAYSFKDIDQMASIISSASKNDVIDMYLIADEYDLEGSRPIDSQVTVNVHGLKNNEGKLNAAVDCAPINPSITHPRELHGINFVFDNLTMNGSLGYLYSGLFASSIVYNHCHFTKMQSLYSPTVILNDCTFDARTGEGVDADYSFYGYNSTNVEFNRCDFHSDGKAMKIYSEGAGDGAVYKFNDCKFYNETKKRNDKPAIAVDSTWHSPSSGGHPYKIYISRCEQIDFPSLYGDESIYARFIITDI